MRTSWQAVHGHDQVDEVVAHRRASEVGDALAAQLLDRGNV
jgi:hypothetical protein